MSLLELLGVLVSLFLAVGMVRNGSLFIILGVLVLVVIAVLTIVTFYVGILQFRASLRSLLICLMLMTTLLSQPRLRFVGRVLRILLELFPVAGFVLLLVVLSVIAFLVLIKVILVFVQILFTGLSLPRTDRTQR